MMSTYYQNDAIRKHRAAVFNAESYKIFNDSFLLSNRNNLTFESIEITKFLSNGMMGNRPSHEYTFQFVQMQNLEYLKLGCAFELSLKAQLLYNGILLHKMKNQSEAKEQKKTPIKIIDSMDYESKISTHTLEFSTLLEPNYVELYELSKAELEYIESIRRLRNEIHFPEDGGVDSTQWGKVCALLLNYVNEKIVKFNESISHEVLVKPMLLPQKIL